jgi:hypothetical protein
MVTITFLGLHVECPVFFPPTSIKFGFSWHIFIDVPDIKFYVNLSSGNPSVAWGQTDGRTNGGAGRLSVWYCFTQRGRLLWWLSVACNNKTCLGLNGKCPILIKFGFSLLLVIEVSSTKLRGNPSSWSRADTCGQAGRQAGRPAEAKSRVSGLCERA